MSKEMPQVELKADSLRLIAVTQMVLICALLGTFFTVKEAAAQAERQALDFDSKKQELSRLDTSRYLHKSPGGQVIKLEPIAECRDPLSTEIPNGRNQSVIVMAPSKDLSSMRKDRNVWERSLRRAPQTKASLVLQVVQHGREQVMGTFEGLYLIRGFNDELRLSGTIDEMGTDGINLTKAVDVELKSSASTYASFAGDQVFECRLTHPQLIRFE